MTKSLKFRPRQGNTNAEAYKLYIKMPKRSKFCPRQGNTNKEAYKLNKKTIKNLFQQKDQYFYI